MVEIPVRIRIKEEGAAAAQRSLDDLAGSNDGLTESFDGVAGSDSGGGALGAATAMAGPLLAAATAVAGGIAAAAAATIAFGNELERQAGIINRTQGSVSEASEAVGGLISNIDLMTARNRLMQSGLELTDTSFAAVAEVATDFAAATGEDAVGATQRLGNALRTMSAEGLGEFGVQVDASQTRTVQFASAIEQLRQRSAEMETGADTLGGAIAQLSVGLDNVSTDFLAVINDSQTLTPLMHMLGTEVETLANLFGVTLSDSFSIGIRAGAIFVAFFEDRLQRLISTVRNLSNAIGSAQGGNFAASFRFAAAAAGDLGDVSLNINSILERANTLAAQFTQHRRDAAAESGPIADSITTPTAARGGSAAPAAVGPTETEMFMMEQAVDASQELADIRAIDRDAEAIAAQNRASDQADLLSRQLEINDAAREERAIRNDVNASILQAVGDFSQLSIGQQDMNKLLTASRQKTAAWSSTVKTVEDGFSTVQPLLSEAVNILVKGGENMEQAFVEALDSFLANFAIQEGFEAAKEFVLAIAAFPNPTTMASHASAGAGHAALAIAAGGISAAIPNAGGAPGGASAQSREPDAGETSEGGRQVVINIGVETFATEAEVGRAIRQAMEAENRRF